MIILITDILRGAGKTTSDEGRGSGIKINRKITLMLPHNNEDNGDADEVDKTCDTLKSCVLAGLHL